MKTFKVGNILVFLDDDDWLRLCIYTWRVKDNGKGYKSIVRSQTKDGKHCTIYMHREIMNTPKGMECHHKESNTFDNRKIMLENLNKQEHMRKDRELACKKECGNNEVPF